MQRSKYSDQQEKPRILKVHLPSGNTVLGRLNGNVFTAKGNVQSDSIFSAEKEVPFISLEWPEETCPVIFFTNWCALITTPFLERVPLFHTSTAENISSNNWEMLKAVMGKCHKLFRAQLLEVTSCSVKLGHPGVASLYEIKSKEEEIKHTLKLLFADTEYEYRDILLNWDVTISMNETLRLSELVQPQNDHTGSSGSDDNRSSSFARQDQSEEDHLPSDVQTGNCLQGDQIQKDVTAEVCALHLAVTKLEQKMNDQFDKVFKQLNALSSRMSTAVNKLPPVDRSSVSTTQHHLSSSSSQKTEQDRNKASLTQKVKQERQLQSRVTDQNPMAKDRFSRADTKKRPQDSKQEAVPAGKRKEDSQSRSGDRHQAGDLVEDSSGDANLDLSGPLREIKSGTKSRVTNRPSNSEDKRKSAEDSNLHRETSGSSSIGILDASSDFRQRISVLSSHDNANSRSLSQAVPPGRLLNQSEQESLVTSATVSSTQSKHSGQQESTHPLGAQEMKKAADGRRTPEQTSAQSSKPQKTMHKKKAPVSDDAITIKLDSEAEAKLVKEAVDKAYELDAEPAPRANSFDTMLCLDISSSMMEGRAFDQMKRTVHAFIDGVEDVVSESGVEENIGLVTFGGHAAVVQNLTNDFSRIRELVDGLKPGGKSPFVEALLVAMAAFVRKGGIVSVSGEWYVHPRIIFISDGRPTESNDDKGNDVASNINHVRTSVSRMLISFKVSSSFNKVRPVVFVPVGSNADKKYMKAMSDVCGGRYTEPANIKDLCYYFRTQETIGKVLVCFKDKGDKASEEEIKAVVTALSPDLRHVNEKELVEIIQKELKNPDRTRSEKVRVNPESIDLEGVYENTGKVSLGHSLPLGTRVVRGPDWTFGSQDGHSPGTVINHEEKHSWHWVQWDAGSYNRYPQSPRQGFHLAKTEEHPRIKTADLEIGMVVKKGRKWNKKDGDEDLGEGVVIRKSGSQRKVVVRWSNGELSICGYSRTEDSAEVEYWDGKETTYLVPSNSDSSKKQEGTGKWQWNDGSGGWINYDLNTNEQIEKEFQKRPTGSILINRDGRQRRIMFKRKTERLVDGNVEFEVRRI